NGVAVRVLDLDVCDRARERAMPGAAVGRQLAKLPIVDGADLVGPVAGRGDDRDAPATRGDRAAHRLWGGKGLDLAVDAKPVRVAVAVGADQGEQVLVVLRA